MSVELARRAALTPVQHNAENRIQQQLYAARSPLTGEAASRREAGTVIDDPDIQAAINMVASSRPKGTASIPRPPTPAKSATEGPMQAEPDPAAGLD